MKQTAVNYLVNELKKSKHFQRLINEVSENKTIVEDIILQAKELEQEQIMEAHYAPKYGCFSEKYYDETFGDIS
jgi:hypothetical protein